MGGARAEVISDRVMVAIAAGVAVWPLTGILTGPRAVAEVAGAVVLAVLLSTWWSPRRPSWMVSPVSVLVLGAYELGVVCRGTGVAEALGAAGDALAAGRIPGGPDPVPVAVAYVVAFAAAELAARSPAVSACNLAIAGGHVGSLVLVGARAPTSPLPTAVLVAVLLAAPVLRRAGCVSARPVGAVVTLGVVTVCAVGAAVVMFGDAVRVDVWARDHPPAGPDRALTPLADLAQQLATADDPVVARVQLTGWHGTGPLRLPVAVLDEYDGDTWGLGPEHRFAPLPAGAGPPHRSGAVTQRITLTDAYPGRLLPRLDGIIAVASDAGATVEWERSSGMIRRTAPAPPLRYDVVSAPAAAASASVAAEPARPRPLLADPPMELVRFWSELPGADAAARLDAAVAVLSGPDIGYDPRALAGHSYPRLVALVGRGASPDPRWRTGTAEQIASLLAVLARVGGLRADVVVGYDLGTVTPAEPGAVLGFDVRSHQAHAWVRVLLPGRGWVTVDPTARRERGPAPWRPAPAGTRPAPPLGQVPAIPASPAPPTGDGPAGGEQGDSDSDRAPQPCAGPAPAPGCPAAPARSPDDRAAVVAVVAVLVPVVLAAVTAMVPMARALRRRVRRRRGDTVRRVVAAWAETEDRLRTHGLRVRPSCTVHDLADDAARAGLDSGVPAALRSWANVLDVALYNRDGPGEHVAGLAWAADRSVGAALRARTPRTRRLRAAIDPRPLLRPAIHGVTCRRDH